MRGEAFRPFAGQAIATSVVSATTKLTRGQTVRVANQSAVAAEGVFIKFGDSSVVATAQDIYIQAGGIASFFNIAPMPEGLTGGGSQLGATHIAIIAASGTPTINVQTGDSGF